MATEVVSREAQREFPRWPVTAARPVRVDLGPAGSGQIVDISAGGMRVKMVAPLRRDAEIPVRIEIPDKPNPVQCSGVVVWSKPNGAAGIRFTKLTDEHKAVLTTWLTSLEYAASENSPQRDEFARITAQIAAMKLNNADALSLIARRVTQFANASGVAIALGKAENMICLARAGDAPELGTPIRPSSGIVGECIRGRKMVQVHDSATDPRAAGLKHGSALILPLLVNSELRGVLQIFCAQAHAFDTKTVQTMEKLSDAIVFVTHNVMPQRRPATITSLPKPGAGSAPVITKLTDSGRLAAYSPTKPVVRPTPAATIPTPPVTFEPVVSAAPQPIEIAPIAETVQPVVSLPVATKPPLEIIRPLPPAPPRAIATSAPFESFHPQPRSSFRWVMVVPIAAALVAVPAGLYFWRQMRMPTAPAAMAAAPAATNVALVSSAPAATAAVTPTSTPAATTPSPASTPAVNPPAATASAPPPIEKPRAAVETLASEKKVVIIEKKAPEPAPIVLASGRPVEHQRADEPEAAAPSANQMAIHATSSLPGVPLPSAAAAPKLTAPVAKAWTGGNLLQRISPVYPHTAISQGLEGQVELLAVVTSKGTVEKVRRVSGSPLLVQAATDAVKRWRYEPFRADGEPVDKEISITLNFKIPR